MLWPFNSRKAPKNGDPCACSAMRWCVRAAAGDSAAAAAADLVDKIG